MEAMGIIFSNVYDSNMGDLTGHRTSAAIPFAGRYRQIDFALSNMSQAQIRNIGIITKYNYESLMNHIGSCAEWDLVMEEDGVVLLPPYATGHTGVYRGKLEALYTALAVLEHGKQEYVVLTDTTVLAAVDYADAVKKHIRSGCDISVIGYTGVADGKRINAFSGIADENGKPKVMAVDYASPAGYSVSMGMFIIGRQKLIDVIKTFVPQGKYHLERDYILAGFNSGEVSVNIIEFGGTALFNESLKEYYDNSMALLNKDVRNGLFHSKVPIYTKPRNEVPTRHGKNAKVVNTVAADGSYLEGTCERSILFREVKLEEGSTVRDCVIMQGSHVGVGADLQYVILDKDVTVKPYTKLVGSPDHPLYIKKGATV